MDENNPLFGPVRKVVRIVVILMLVTKKVSDSIIHILIPMIDAIASIDSNILFLTTFVMVYMLSSIRNTGPYTDYFTGVQFEIALRTEYNEELFFKVFRSLPEWDVETDLGTTKYWVFEATHVNNRSQDLLDVACDEDAEMVDCRRSIVFPTWNDTIPAYYPG